MRRNLLIAIVRFVGIYMHWRRNSSVRSSPSNKPHITHNQRKRSHYQHSSYPHAFTRRTKELKFAFWKNRGRTSFVNLSRSKIRHDRPWGNQTMMLENSLAIHPSKRLNWCMNFMKARQWHFDWPRLFRMAFNLTGSFRASGCKTFSLSMASQSVWDGVAWDQSR